MWKGALSCGSGTADSNSGLLSISGKNESGSISVCGQAPSCRSLLPGAKEKGWQGKRAVSGRRLYGMLGRPRDLTPAGKKTVLWQRRAEVLEHMVGKPHFGPKPTCFSSNSNFPSRRGLEQVIPSLHINFPSCKNGHDIGSDSLGSLCME